MPAAASPAPTAPVALTLSRPRRHGPTVEQRSACAVALVSMPFVSVHRPSLQLGLLKAIAERAGFPAETLHLCIPFASQIGTRAYEELVHHRGRMFGDWLFSVAAFGESAPDPDGALLDRFSEEADLLLADVGLTREQLLGVRDVQVPRYIESMVDDVDWGGFRVVGFTSTFQQNAASFALARRLKERWPETTIVFGGANFEGEMGDELARLPWVDHVVKGEADETFPEYLDALAVGADPREVPGVVADGVSDGGERAPFVALDELPVPDYSEYFARALAAGVVSETSRRLVHLPFESARGCWWGQKHHCTFCGLNGSTIGFRSKSPARVADELASLARSYGSFRFEAVDNIMDMRYFTDLLPRIRADALDYEFFYEVKSNLSREKIRSLRESGVVRIQPGIESVDSTVLKLMRKGVTGLQNINLLRWAAHYGIDVGWNMIWGFPGERQESYTQQLETLKLLRHLQPPTGAGRIWLERFSPLFQEEGACTTEYVRPEESYSYVYPPYLDLRRIAYFFDYRFVDALSDEVYLAIRDEVRDWQAAWKGSPRPSLFFWSSPDQILIEDFRDPGQRGVYRFYDELAEIYRACSERPCSVANVAKGLASGRSVVEVEEALVGFATRGLMAREGDTFLSLALPASRGR
ncbi:RiPP maturation radical SAM C-methyltransferase [Trujillonella humicola]|uniref:RiPP maturation radical SAM C-methyltransferase n=1 Tax=Trujillonella humicola TaxID=3383699 RepID=UPI003906C2DC